MRITDELFNKAISFKAAQSEYFHLRHGDSEQLAAARACWQREACELAAMVLEQIELDVCACSCRPARI